MGHVRHYLGINVLEAAQQRIAWVFDTFKKICVSFSGGKDSSVMLHLVMGEAIRRERKVCVLFVDLEGQYKLTINFIEQCYAMYADHIEPYWVALPILLRNAVSVYEPRWKCWDPNRRDDWIRESPKIAITDTGTLPFFQEGMEFEEFAPAFGKWYAGGEPCACLVGIRTSESLNRWRTIWSQSKETKDGRGWTTRVSGTTWNCYPIYDWKTEDIWVYNGKSGKPYNKLYDRMSQAGLSIHQQRICQPYGDDQRKGLWLFHIIEPETWGRVVARVNGANQGALYAKESGNALGRIKINKPDGHTWQSFAKLLLVSMPAPMQEHYRRKILVFLQWWKEHGYAEIPDELSVKWENGRGGERRPSWRRVCKTLLRNDYWCKGLSFSQNSSDKEVRERYRKLMKKREGLWNLTL